MYLPSTMGEGRHSLWSTMIGPRSAALAVEEGTRSRGPGGMTRWREGTDEGRPDRRVLFSKSCQMMHARRANRARESAEWVREHCAHIPGMVEVRSWR